MELLETARFAILERSTVTAESIIIHYSNCIMDDGEALRTTFWWQIGNVHDGTRWTRLRTPGSWTVTAIKGHFIDWHFIVMFIEEIVLVIVAVTRFQDIIKPPLSKTCSQ